MYPEEHIENMDGCDPTEKVCMPEMYLEFSEQELKRKNRKERRK